MKRFLFVILVLFLTAGFARAQFYRFAVICDTRSDSAENGKNGVNVAAVKGMCRQLNLREVEFVLAPGDFICGNVNWYKPKPPANDTQYQTFLKAASTQGVGLPGSGNKILFYPVRGNHEAYYDIVSKGDAEKAWIKNMGVFLPKNGPVNELGFSYSFLYKNSLFLGLDQFISADIKKKTGISVNNKWIDKQLKKHPGAEHVFVFGHTPAFTAHHKDCLAQNTLARNKFLRSVHEKSFAYFCGHDHFYARARIPVYKEDGKIIESYIEQIIIPGGAPFLTGNRKDNHKWDGIYLNKDVVGETYIDNSVGFLLVTVDDDKIDMEYIATNDACSFYKDEKGIYHYTYNENWESWNFVTMDRKKAQKKIQE